MRLKIILVWFLLTVVGGTAWGQRDGPKDEAPRLFSLPGKTVSPVGVSDKQLHQMQYQEVKEYILRLYYDHDGLLRIPNGKGIPVLDSEDKRDLEIQKLVGYLGDRWTIYRSPAQLSKANEHNALGDIYLGLMLDRMADGTYVVAYVSGRSPAYSAGLRRGDQIVDIDGVELKGLSSEDVDEHLYAQPGDVKVTYKVNDVTEKVVLKAAAVNAANVTAKSVGDYWYFHVQHFMAEKMLSDFSSEAARLNRSTKGVPKGIILDLRGNQGGYMEVAYQFVSVFVEKGKIGEQVMRSGRVTSRTILEAQPFLPTLLEPTADNLRLVSSLQTAPLVVLVDGSTISAGEMTASALQGTKRATIIGTTTWGKGVSFHQLTLSSGGQLQLCTGAFFGPTGLDHRNKGIKPDVVVEQTRRSAVDSQLEAGVKHLKSVHDVQDARDLAWTYMRIAAAVYLLGVMLALLVVVIVMERRTQRAHKRQRDQWRDTQAAVWLSQFERSAESPAAAEEEEFSCRCETVLGANDFMVGARCHSCNHKFSAGETVLEVFAGKEQYMCCRNCQPAV